MLFSLSLCISHYVCERVCLHEQCVCDVCFIWLFFRYIFLAVEHPNSPICTSNRTNRFRKTYSGVAHQIRFHIIQQKWHIEHKSQRIIIYYTHNRHTMGCWLGYMKLYLHTIMRCMMQTERERTINKERSGWICESNVNPHSPHQAHHKVGTDPRNATWFECHFRGSLRHTTHINSIHKSIL